MAALHCNYFQKKFITKKLGKMEITFLLVSQPSSLILINIFEHLFCARYILGIRCTLGKENKVSKIDHQTTFSCTSTFMHFSLWISRSPTQNIFALYFTYTSNKLIIYVISWPIESRRGMITEVIY